MIEDLSIEEVETILSNSFNYDKVRRYAVNIFYRTNLPNGISEKCKIIFNPYRHLLIEYDYDLLNEKYFDFERFDEELTDLQAINFKKSFVFAFQYLYKHKELQNEG